MKKKKKKLTKYEKMEKFNESLWDRYCRFIDKQTIELFKN